MRFSLSKRRADAARHFLVRQVAACVVSTFAFGSACNALAASGATVKDVVEFTRIVLPPGHTDETLQNLIAPTGDQALIVTRGAEVSTDKTWYDLLLLDLLEQALLDPARTAPQRLLRIEARRDNNFGTPYVQDFRWHDARTILFRARFSDGPYQGYALDVITRQLRQLTFSEYGVVSFAVSRDMARVVYAAPFPNPAIPPGVGSIVVGTHSFWSVKHGQHDMRAQKRMYRFFVATATDGSPGSARPVGDPFPESGWWPPVSISPDGRWVVLHRWEPQRLQAWAKDYPFVANTSKLLGPGVSIDPLSYFSTPSSYIPRRLVAYRVADGKEQAVVDAPDDALTAYGQTRSDRLWQGTGNSIVIAGTHLPIAADAGTPSGRRAHIIEYWPDSNRWNVIAALIGHLEAAYPLAADGGAFVAIDGDKRRSFARDDTGAWREVTTASSAAELPTKGALPRPWKLRIQQALNTPPNVFAVGAAGQAVQLTDLNPQFLGTEWGTMQPYAWKDAKRREWKGGLMLPKNFDPKVRYPLVIQTYGFSPDNFYLDGANLAGGATSGFAGRAFMRHDMLLLAMPVGPSSGKTGTDHGLILDFEDGVQGAVEALAGQGTVDRDRVGILGWSMTGEHVLNLVTFSGAPIRAASILDGDANTVFSMTVTYGRSDATVARKERANEGGPYGESLERWVRNDPAMNTHCVRSALRIETYGPAVLNNWDIYALLRRQYKPVEMVVVADGAHALARPSDRMVSLQGNVDWFSFWLKGEERSDIVIPGETNASLKDQYTRWHQMVELKRADEAKPTCAAR